MNENFTKTTKHYGITEEEKNDIQEAIEAAYQNPNAEALRVPRKSAVPTVEEIIEYVTEKILNSLS